jgi:uncharacterized protein YqeY
MLVLQRSKNMLYPQIKSEMSAAQKAGDSRLLGVLKLIISELSYAQVDYKGGDLPDEVVFKVLQKEAKKRKESIEAYEKYGSQERADQEKYELEVIEKYLPTLMSEVDTEAEIDKIAAETGLRNGKLIGAVMGKLRGKADGNVIQKVVMQKYQ